MQTLMLCTTWARTNVVAKLSPHWLETSISQLFLGNKIIWKPHLH